MMIVRREIDLHGMDRAQAKKCLDSYISALPHGETELTVIHGYNRGKSLGKMAADYSHRRLVRKIHGLNPGTILFLIK